MVLVDVRRIESKSFKNLVCVIKVVMTDYLFSTYLVEFQLPDITLSMFYISSKIDCPVDLSPEVHLQFS